MLINYLYSSDADINTEVFTADYSAALARVELPTLVLCGQYDFICPPELERDFFNRISSSDKSMAQSATSGHNMMFQDEEFFCREIICFIDQQK